MNARMDTGRSATGKRLKSHRRQRENYSMRHRYLSNALAAACLSAVAAFPLSVSADDVLRVVPNADLRDLDPVWTTSLITQRHAYMVYDTLFAMDDGLVPQPQMVGDFSMSDDGLSYIFQLREGLKFHDGAPVTSEDVVASIERWAARSSAGSLLIEATETLEATGPSEFRIVLSEPFGLVLESLASLTGPFIMPKAIAETDPFEQIDSPIGSGPFVFNEDLWVPGNKVVYEKFEDYVPRDDAPSGAAGGKVVKLDRVEWFYLPDAGTAMAALQNDEIDYWEAPPIDLLPVLEADPDVTVGIQDAFGRIVIMRPNHLYPPFDKPEARQALSYLVDQTEYMTAVVGNPEYWQTCPSLMMCGTPAATSAGGGERMETGNTAKAKELMDQVYDGETVVIMHPTDHVTGAAALLTAARLRDIGVDVEVQAMDWSTLAKRRASKNPPADGGWNIFHTRNDIAAASPITHLGVAAGENSWFGWPSNPGVEELRAAWGATADDGTRTEIMDELHTELMASQPFVMLGQYQAPSAWRNDVLGIVRSPVLGFWNVSFDQ